jgi:hypothetical protein
MFIGLAMGFTPEEFNGHQGLKSYAGVLMAVT